MPAVRFIWNGVTEQITATSYKSNHSINVRLHNGKERRISCMGFICKAGTLAMPEGSYCKVIVGSVAISNGENDADWIRVYENQYVLGWRMLWNQRGHVDWAAFIIVDNLGCPIVMTDKNYKPPTNKKAGVYWLATKKKRDSGDKPKPNSAQKAG